MDVRGSDWRLIPWEGLVRRPPVSPHPRREITRVNPSRTMSGASTCSIEVKTAHSLSHRLKTLTPHTAQSLAESIGIQTARSSSSASPDIEERGNHQDPHSTHSAHGGGRSMMMSAYAGRHAPCMNHHTHVCTHMHTCMHACAHQPTHPHTHAQHDITPH